MPIGKKMQLVLLGMLCSIAMAIGINTLLAKLPKKWDVTSGFDLFFYNLCFKPSLKPYPRLMIIDSNDPAEKRSRSEYAKMVSTLQRAGARCIALDIRFLGERPEYWLGDQALVDSVAAAPQVILAMDFASERHPPADLRVKAERLALPDSLCEILIPKIVAEHGLDLSFGKLLEVTPHLGHINSASGQYYHFPPVLPFVGKCYAALPLEIARHYFGACNHGHVATNGNGEFANTSATPFVLSDIPLDVDGQLLVNFIPLSEFAPQRYYYSWDEAGRLLQENYGGFRDAVVLIVNAAVESPINSPLGPYPRWALLASLTSQLLLDAHIDTSVVFYPIFFSTVICGGGLLLFLFVAPRLNKKWRKTRVIFVLGTAFFLLLIVALLRYEQLWLGAFVPLLVYNASMLVVRYRYYRLIRPPRYVNFGVAVLERRKDGYPIKIFEAPGGTEETDLILNSSFLQEKNFRAALARLKNLQASDADIKAVGNQLFEALFLKEAFYILKSSLEQVMREGKNLRLVLYLDAPELTCLPWELLHSAKLPPGHLGLNKRVSVVRYLPRAQIVKKPPFRAPLEILVVISNPAGLMPLDVESEKKTITKALQPLIWSGDVHLRFCEHATLDVLRAELKRGPDVLHYIGHSQFDEKQGTAFLELETETQDLDSVPAEQFGNLLHDSSVRVVVLNSCESAAASANDAFTGVAQKLVDVGVPAVVAMQYKILDPTAQLFSKVLYSSVITNYSIDAAVAESRLALLTGARTDRQGWATPVLFMRTPDGKIFEMDS
ncbi:MAG: CHAT domain-containing protein [bacterium]